MPVVYGIYTVCISLTIFLSYADLGFLMAGEKFAAESYSRNDSESERAFIGTSVFIYMVVCLFIIVGVLICAWDPSLLIRDIKIGDYQYDIAQKLLLILALSIPFTFVYKYINLVYKIRLESYKIQRLSIIGSLIVILSVPFVFFNNKYDIIGYYIFSQVITISVSIYYLIKCKENGYTLGLIIKSLRYNKANFLTMKGLALSGFVSCICWLLCYEMDMILISTILGAQMVALYAIGRSLNNMLRSVFAIIYSPYSVRFNYFVGENDSKGLKDFFYVLIRLFCYFTVIPILVFIFYTEPFVVSWVGNGYIGSVIAVQLLVICFLPNFISSPANYVVIALNKFKGIVIASVLQLLFFYLCVFSLIWNYDINSVALAKCLVNYVAAVYYLILVLNLFKDSFWAFIRKIRLLNMIIPCTVAVIVSYLMLPVVGNVSKSPNDLLKVLVIMSFVIILSLLSAFVSDKFFRKELFSVINLKK